MDDAIERSGIWILQITGDGDDRQDKTDAADGTKLEVLYRVICKLDYGLSSLTWTG